MAVDAEHPESHVATGFSNEAEIHDLAAEPVVFDAATEARELNGEGLFFHDDFGSDDAGS